MKSLKNLLFVFLFTMVVLPCNSQTQTPKDVLAILKSAASDFNYDEIKKHVSERNVRYIDEAKTKIENPKEKFKKSLVSVALQTLQYDVAEETVSANGKSSTLKTNMSVMSQPFTVDIVFILENNKWKIDNIPNAEDIPNQVPILKSFIK